MNSPHGSSHNDSLVFCRVAVVLAFVVIPGNSRRDRYCSLNSFIGLSLPYYTSKDFILCFRGSYLDVALELVPTLTASAEVPHCVQMCQNIANNYASAMRRAFQR